MSEKVLFRNVLGGSYIRKAGVSDDTVFIKLADAFSGACFLHYPDGRQDGINAISLKGEPGYFEDEDEVVVVTSELVSRDNWDAPEDFSWSDLEYNDENA